MPPRKTTQRFFDTATAGTANFRAIVTSSGESFLIARNRITVNGGTLTNAWLMDWLDTRAVQAATNSEFVVMASSGTLYINKWETGSSTSGSALRSPVAGTCVTSQAPAKLASSAVTAAGASVRFLPAYSPDLNPIEMMWSKVKASLRATEARTHPDLLAAIAQALSRVTAQDAINWFAACGYSFI